MDWTIIQRNWIALVPRMTQRWPEADESILLSFEGDRDALVSYLTQLRQVDRAVAQADITDFAAGALPADVRMNALNDNANIDNSARMIHPGETPLDDDALFGDDNPVATPIGRSA